VAHATSLRVIGQSLEAARLTVFELRMEGEDLLVVTDALSQTAEWILRRGLYDHWKEETDRPAINQTVRFTPLDISLLDRQARRQRGVGLTPSRQAFNRLSQLLRTVGEHLDRTDANSFRVLWGSAEILVDSASADGHHDVRTFSVEKLEQLGSSLRFRRSSRSQF
jgi:hypothetical protein